MTPEQKKSENDSGSAWPGGWYVFNEGRVEGPYSAHQAFEMDAMTNEGKPLLISRRGFTQWYALKDMAEIFNITEGFGKRVAFEKAAMALKNNSVSIADYPDRTASTATSPAGNPKSISAEPLTKVLKRQVGPKPLVNAQSFGYAPPGAIESPLAPSTVIKSRSTLTNKDQEPSAAPATLLKDPKELNRQQLMQEYFFVRGRMRLGKMRNPWASAFFGVPITLGLILPFWMNSLLKEIFYHSANDLKIPRWIVPVGMIPGLHLLAIHRLARLVREMEKQNRYGSISPLLATVFGIFPPFAMAYLQDGANRHWLLHARHSGVPK